MPLKVFEDGQCFFATVAANRMVVIEGTANGGPLGIAEQAAAIVFVELNAAYTCRLTIGHAGDRGTDGWRNTACATAYATVHGMCSVRRMKTITIGAVYDASAMAPLSMPSKACTRILLCVSRAIFSASQAAICSMVVGVESRWQRSRGSVR